MNKSVMKCCICNNENIGEFITINNEKYHLCCINQLQQENKQLKDNWNKLKKDLELVVDYGLGDESSKGDKIYGEYAKSTLKFMQELEQGSDKKC